MIPSAKPAKLGLKDAVRDLETENHNLDGKLKEAMREIKQVSKSFQRSQILIPRPPQRSVAGLILLQLNDQTFDL